MALSLETFEQMTAEQPLTNAPHQGYSHLSPTLRLPTILKLNNNAAGFSLASQGAPKSFSAPTVCRRTSAQSFASGHVKFDEIQELVSGLIDLSARSRFDADSVGFRSIQVRTYAPGKPGSGGRQRASSVAYSRHTSPT